LLAILGILTGCSHKKKPSLSGDEPVEFSDFTDIFPQENPPCQFSDTSVAQKEKDSLLISYKVFTQFVPDSVAKNFFGKGIKPKIYPICKVEGPEEIYLFVKTLAGNKKAAFALAFNKKNKWLDGLPVLQADNYSSTAQSVNIDKTYSIYKIVTRKNADGTTSDGKDVYSLGRETGKFSLIMTDALDDKITELINPIDTLRRKNKYSADYGTGKMNLVSIRDGRKNDRFSFFIHFEKSSGGCTGELKGEAMIKSATVAEYRQGGDPCVLRFSFSSSSVTLKEVEGCGSHRGVRCSFDGTFPRRKQVKPAVKKPVKKN